MAQAHADFVDRMCRGKPPIVRGTTDQVRSRYQSYDCAEWFSALRANASALRAWPTRKCLTIPPLRTWKDRGALQKRHDRENSEPANSLNKDGVAPHVIMIHF
jgi:hypothetical protein